MEQCPSWEGNRISASQEILRNLLNMKFITTFTSDRHLSLSRASSIGSIFPHHNFLLYSSHLHLCLPSVLFTHYYTPQILHKLLPSPIGTTCPSHFILLDFITRTILGEQYRSLLSTLCSFLHSLVTSTQLGPVILNTLFSNTFSLRSSGHVRRII